MIAKGLVGEKGRWEMSANGCGLSLWDDRNALELDSGDGFTTL